MSTKTKLNITKIYFMLRYLASIYTVSSSDAANISTSSISGTIPRLNTGFFRGWVQYLKFLPLYDMNGKVPHLIHWNRCLNYILTHCVQYPMFLPLYDINSKVPHLIHWNRCLNYILTHWVQYPMFLPLYDINGKAPHLIHWNWCLNYILTHWGTVPYISPPVQYKR